MRLQDVDGKRGQLDVGIVDKNIIMAVKYGCTRVSFWERDNVWPLTSVCDTAGQSRPSDDSLIPPRRKTECLHESILP
jgi:hypothetical protein